MNSVIDELNNSFKKHAVVNVRSGDTVRVHQKIKEGAKERVQVFEGLVIRVKNKNSHTASILVRRLSGGIGVEKSYLLHSPLVIKVEVTKRGKVRRNYLTYMRSLQGKKARLTSQVFDKNAVNAIPDMPEVVEDVSKIDDVEAGETTVESTKDNTEQTA